MPTAAGRISRPGPGPRRTLVAAAGALALALWLPAAALAAGGTSGSAGTSAAASPTSPPIPPLPSRLEQPAPRAYAAFQVGQMLYATVARGERSIALQAMDAAPFVSGGRTFVPVRFLAAAIGVKGVAWDPAARTATLTAGRRTVVLVAGVKAIRVDGAEQPIDVAPVLRDGRIFLPARHVAEAFGWQVQWLPEYQAVLLLGP